MQFNQDKMDAFLLVLFPNIHAMDEVSKKTLQEYYMNLIKGIYTESIPNHPKIGVAISGPNQTDIGVDERNNLIVTSHFQGTRSYISFGPATKANFEAIINYFNRIKIHAIDAWPNDKSGTT
jgi:hypothetical protein